MKPLRAVIVDDEPLARTALRAAITPEQNVAVVAEFGDGPAAVAGLRKHRPDLVFLDVQMPGLDGFGVLGELDPAEWPAVVIVTAFDQFALRAFDIHAIDYVLKPFDEARLHRAIAEVRDRLRSDRWEVARGRLASLVEELSPVARPGGVSPVGGGPARRVLVRGENEVFRYVRFEEVAWIEAAGNNVRLHTTKAIHEVRMSLRAMLPQLDPGVFRRIHRSTIVNLNAVREIQPWFAGDCVVILVDATQLRMSRTYRDQLIQPLL